MLAPLLPSRFLLCLLALLVILPPTILMAATPSSGTVSQTNPTVTWTGPPTAPDGSSTCNGPNDPSCDNFKLTIVPPAASFGPYKVVIQTVSALSGDWDLQVYDPNGNVIGSSGNGAGTPTSPEVEQVVLINPVAGTYTVAASPFAPMVGTDGTSYHGSASLQSLTGAVGGNGTEPLSYAIFPNPNGISAGEPSCGADWSSKRIMYQAGLTTMRVSFNECASPTAATWEDKSFTTTSIVSLDSILFTDRFTNRSFVSQLTGVDSLAAFSDNDGDSWTPSQGGGIPSGPDHETVGGGPYHPPLIGTVYPDAVYYCSQNIVGNAECARSDDGGITYGPGIVIYQDPNQCQGGIHGHVKVSPADGTVYVPFRACNGQQAVTVSQDNGITWTVRPVPGTSSGDWDPSVGIASDGTVYLGEDDGTGHPLIAVSHDKGQTWSAPIDVGALVPPQQSTDTAGIKSTAFPAVVAGDPLRAAFAFFGSTFAPGGGADNANWGGVWHLYVAHTYDGGNTWTTFDVTGNDPIQRNATICAGGTLGCGNGTRNLLDFIDATIDQAGRVVIAYPDGCIGACASGGPNSFSSLSTIARQVNGRRMFAADDIVSPGPPSPPLVTAAIDCTNSTLVNISWTTPANNGSAITGYNIYRSTSGGPFVLLKSVPATSNETTDTITSGQSVAYQVTAVNALGESPACGSVTPTACTPTESSCVAPGVTVLTDAVGDALDMQPSHDIVKLSIAEPASLGPGKIMMVLKMASLQNVPPNTTWPIVFHAPAGDFWVRMSDVVTQSNPTGAVKFAYGSGTQATALTPLNCGAPPAATCADNPGTPADPASNFNADGTISIVIPRSAIGNPAPGAILTNFLVRVSVEAGASSLTPDNMPNSLTPAGSYTIFGSENCAAQCTAPTANADSATTTENQSVIINVVANDGAGGSTPLTVTSVSQPSNGTATNNGDGTVTYHPNSNFVGSDSFNYTIKNGCGATATGHVSVTVNAPPPPQCFEDDDKHISYGNGWHTVSNSNASAGHYHLETGNSSQSGMVFTFQQQSSQGTLQYFYANSSKGGTADVYIDGAFSLTINYQGGTSSMHDPTFGASTTFTIIGSGQHTFELRNVNGPAYVDKICLSNGSSTTTASAGPGTTTTNTSTVAIGQTLLQSLIVPSNALAYAVTAEASINVPYKLVVLDPTGTVLGTVNSDSRGIATVEGPASTTGTYMIQVVNLGVAGVSVWTAATPRVTY